MTDPRDPPAPSRYRTVRDILDAAAGDSSADYDSKGRFWHLPYQEFLEVSVYGVRMIAPAPEPVPCDGDQPATDPYADGGDGDADRFAACHDPEPRGPVPHQPVHPGRGAASGLVKGLRGQHPFAGRHLPPLPWGGSRVVEAKIRFISEWIDDGCPQDDTADPVAAPMQAQARLKTLAGLTMHPQIAKSQDFKTRRNEAIQRKNVEFLTDDELCKLRYAIAQMKKLNYYNDFSPQNHRRRFDRRSYDNWARIHSDTCPHGWELFLPWHRMYLYEFEQAMRDIVPDVALMFWDWTMPRYQQGATGEIPVAFKGWLDADGLKGLEKKIVTPGLMDKLASVQDRRFNSINRLLLAANSQGNDLPNGAQTERMKTFRDFVKTFRTGGNGSPDDYQRIVDALGEVNPLWSALRFPGEFYTPDAMAASFHHHYPTADDVHNITNSIDNFRDFGGGSVINQSFGALDMNAHNTIHIWSGGFDLYYPQNSQVNGDMLANLTAAWDPIFWGHHGNVDRVWNLWQERHPGLGPADGDATIAPFSYRVSDSLSIERLGYEYVTGSVVFESDRKIAFSRYQTDPGDCPTRIFGDSCRNVEIRIHDFVQPNDSCFIRVFLNQPGADGSTPMSGNPNFVGQIPVFGHGSCVGGPGHCDAPAPKTRSHDLRPPDHNTPWNYRLDGTACLHGLREGGAENVQVNMVAVAANGREAPELLRFDAVSLNFTG